MFTKHFKLLINNSDTINNLAIFNPIKAANQSRAYNEIYV